MLTMQAQSDRDVENGNGGTRAQEGKAVSEDLLIEMMQAAADKELEEKFEARERGEADEDQTRSR